jgi:hypothetical protein
VRCGPDAEDGLGDDAEDAFRAEHKVVHVRTCGPDHSRQTRIMRQATCAQQTTCDMRQATDIVPPARAERHSATVVHSGPDLSSRVKPLRDVRIRERARACRRQQCMCACVCAFCPRARVSGMAYTRRETELRCDERLSASVDLSKCAAPSSPSRACQLA